MPLPQDVQSFVTTTFVQADVPIALDALRTATIEDGTPASERLVRCCAISSQGNLARLMRSVALLKVDWRDVIMQGEYEMRDGESVRIRDLSNPIQW